MTKTHFWLYFVIALCGATHFGYTLLEQRDAPDAAYFSNGSFLTSEGSEIHVNMRMQFSGDGTYDFIQAGAWYLDLLRRIQGRFWGSMKFVTVSANSSSDQPPPQYSDEDLVFNKAYRSSGGALLTFYALTHEDDKICFYVRELSKVRCYGQRRAPR